MGIKGEIGIQKAICSEKEEDMKSQGRPLTPVRWGPVMPATWLPAVDINVFLYLFKDKYTLEDWEPPTNQYYILNARYD